MHFTIRLVSVLLAAILLAACQSPAPAASPSATATTRAVTPILSATARPSPAAVTPAASPAPAARTVLVLQTAAGKQVEVMAEVVTTPAGRARGLMFRERLAENEGMLFVFPADTTSGFWMENTKVPLSIAWVDVEGAIVGMADMQPLSRDVHAPPRAYRYALEVPQGFFARQGVKVGDRLLYRTGNEVLPINRLPAATQAT